MQTWLTPCMKVLKEGNQDIHRTLQKGTEQLLKQHFLFISYCPDFRILHKAGMPGKGLRDCCSFRLSSFFSFFLFLPFFLFLKITFYFLQRVVYGQGWRSLGSCTPGHHHQQKSSSGQSVANSAARMSTCQEKSVFSFP